MQIKVGVSCSGCGKWYADENATVEYEDKANDTDFIIPALGHSFTNYVADADAFPGTTVAECDHGCGTKDIKVAPENWNYHYSISFIANLQQKRHDVIGNFPITSWTFCILKNRHTFCRDRRPRRSLIHT